MTEIGKGACRESSGENQWRFSPPAKEGSLNFRDPDAIIPKSSTPINTAAAWRSTAPFPNCWQGHSTMLRSYRGVYWMQLAAKFGALFLWEASWWKFRQWLNCVVFEKSQLFPTSSTQLTPPHPTCWITWPVSSCWVQSHRGIRVLCKAGTFGACLLERLLSGNQVVLGCVTPPQEDHSYFPPSSTHSISGKGRSVCLHPIGLRAPPLWRLFGSALPSPQYPWCLSSVSWEEGRAAGSWGFLSVFLGGYCLVAGWSARPPPVDSAGVTLNGRLFWFVLSSHVAPLSWAFSCTGDGCTQPELAACSSWRG